MSRATKEQIREWENSLQQPMTPDQMAYKVENIRSEVLGGNFFTQSGLAFLRDAWTAAQFAQLRSADTIRLYPEDRPDFEMILNGHTQLYEVVEADDPDRKRGDEYKKAMANSGKTGLTHVSDEEIEKNALAAPERIRAAANRKARPELYNSEWRLLIHLNLMVFNERRDEIEGAMHEVTEAAGGVFQEVWILWQKRLYRLWVNGARTNDP